MVFNGPNAGFNGQYDQVSYTETKSMSNELLRHRILFDGLVALQLNVPLILQAAAITFTKHLQAFLYHTRVSPPIICSYFNLSPF